MQWLRRSLVTGFVVTVPLIITVAAFVWLFQLIDGVMGPVYAGWLNREVPGMGLATLLVLVLMVGVLATNVFGSRLLHRGEAYLLRLPVFRAVYGPVKQLVGAFSPDSQLGFKRVVLLDDPHRGLVIGFLTKQFVLDRGRGEEDLVAVYVPTNHILLRGHSHLPHLRGVVSGPVGPGGGADFPDRPAWRCRSTCASIRPRPLLVLRMSRGGKPPEASDLDSQKSRLITCRVLLRPGDRNVEDLSRGIEWNSHSTSCSGGAPPVAAALFAVYLIRSINSRDPGSKVMQRIAALIRAGAMAFLRTEYTRAGRVRRGHVYRARPLLAADCVPHRGQFPRRCFALGAGWGGSVCGRRLAPRCAPTHAATTSLSAALRVAFSSGAVMGLTVVALGTFGVSGLYFAFGGLDDNGRTADRGAVRLFPGCLVDRPLRPRRGRYLHQGSRRGR